MSTAMLGLALATIYLIPVLTEMRFVKVEQWTSGSYNYLQHFVYFSQFFSPEWGYGYAGVGLQDDFSFQLGIVAIALASFALVSMVRRRFPQAAASIVVDPLLLKTASEECNTSNELSLITFASKSLNLSSLTNASITIPGAKAITIFND